MIYPTSMSQTLSCSRLPVKNGFQLGHAGDGRESDREKTTIAVLTEHFDDADSVRRENVWCEREHFRWARRREIGRRRDARRHGRSPLAK